MVGEGGVWVGGARPNTPNFTLNCEFTTDKEAVAEEAMNFPTHP
jgi:hypothetical protein